MRLIQLLELFLFYNCLCTFFLFSCRHMLQMTGKFGYYLGLDRLDELGVIYFVFVRFICM